MNANPLRQIWLLGGITRWITGNFSIRSSFRYIMKNL